MATISRVKTWSSNETLTASDLNAEFNNILTGVNSNALDNTNLSTTATYEFGAVVVGHSAVQTTSAAYNLQALGTGAADSGEVLGRWSADALGPTLSLLKSRNATIGSSTIVQDNDVLGTLEFMADDGGDFATPGATIFARVNGTPGANDMPTELVFATTADAGNTVTERMTISAAGAVNVVGAFTAGSGIAVTALNAATANELVVVGATTTELDAKSTLTYDGSTLAVTGTVEPTGDTAAGDNSAFGYTATEGAILTGQGSTYDVTIKDDADVTVLAVPTGSGAVLKPAQPCFLVNDSGAAANVTGDGTEYTMVWDTEIFDQGGDMTTTTFTAPVTGRYLLSVQADAMSVGAGHTSAQLKIITSNRTYRLYHLPFAIFVAGGYSSPTMTVIADMDAADTVTIIYFASGDTKTIDLGGNAEYGFFSGCLLA